MTGGMQNCWHRLTGKFSNSFIFLSRSSFFSDLERRIIRGSYFYPSWMFWAHFNGASRRICEKWQLLRVVFSPVLLTVSPCLVLGLGFRPKRNGSEKFCTAKKGNVPPSITFGSGQSLVSSRLDYFKWELTRWILQSHVNSTVRAHWVFDKNGAVIPSFPSVLAAKLLLSVWFFTKTLLLDNHFSLEKRKWQAGSNRASAPSVKASPRSTPWLKRFSRRSRPIIAAIPVDRRDHPHRTAQPKAASAVNRHQKWIVYDD